MLCTVSFPTFPFCCLILFHIIEKYKSNKVYNKNMVAFDNFISKTREAIDDTDTEDVFVMIVAAVSSVAVFGLLDRVVNFLTQEAQNATFLGYDISFIGTVGGTLSVAMHIVLWGALVMVLTNWYTSDREYLVTSTEAVGVLMSAGMVLAYHYNSTVAGYVDGSVAAGAVAVGVVVSGLALIASQRE